MPISLAVLPDWASPERVLDPTLEPETAWAQALQAGHPEQAVNTYVAMLREGPPLFDLAFSYISVYERVYECDFGFMGGHQYHPDEVVKQHYVGVYGIEHTFKGEIDWLYDPTSEWGDAHTWEWQVQLNRHYQWVPLARAWQSTGDARYAQAFEKELRSWIGSHCPAPARMDMSLPGTWRTIEAGIRGGWTWPYTLEIFRQCREVSDDAIWLMIAAIREHGRYLLYSPTGCNFKTMENISLAHCGMLLPGLRDSYVYTSTALDRTIAELERQFYDDGLQVELAPSYGVLSAACSYSTFMLAIQKGYAEPRNTRLPPRIWQRLAQTMTVYARFAMPDSFLPDLHDNNRMRAEPLYEEARALPGVELPPTPPYCQEVRCELVPWGGYAVLCREGRYGFLDGGPWGAGHQHGDALQVILWSNGNRWLCDPGKPLYNRTDLTVHIRTSPGHNVVLLDEVRHEADPMILHADHPLPTAVTSNDELAAAAASRWAVTLQEKHFRHERLLLDIRGVGWLVLDFLETPDEVERGWEWLWHFTEDVELETTDDGAIARRADGQTLYITVAASIPLQLKPIHGQDNPLRGWRINETTRERQPLPVLQAKSGPGCPTAVAATIFSAEPVGLAWEAADTLRIGQQTLKLARTSRVTSLTYKESNLSIPEHHLDASAP